MRYWLRERKKKKAGEEWTTAMWTMKTSASVDWEAASATGRKSEGHVTGQVSETQSSSDIFRKIGRCREGYGSCR